MLKLSRRQGERVVLNNGAIEIEVLGTKGDIVQLGFVAPAHVDINRKEIFLKKILQVPEFLKAANN
jgi:carbon storage regulator